ncbi:MAG: hypothetical protein E5Y69_34750, partial [Mesorhizobium sp.]
LQIADAVAREKSIDKSIVIAAMADAIQKAARSRYGQETNIRADINPNTGEMKLQRLMEVVEKVDDYATQIAISSARERNPDAQLGDFIAEQLPPMECPQHKVVSLTGNISPDGSAAFYNVIFTMADRVKARSFPMPLPVIA